jgi:hypothetical protein
MAVASKPTPATLAVAAPSVPKIVSVPSRAAPQEFDEVFFDEAGVRVTRTRFIVAGQTYALNAITSVRQGCFVIPGARGFTMIMLIAGACMLVVGVVNILSSMTSPDGTLAGGFFAFVLACVGGGVSGLAIHVLGRIADTQVHFVAITTASGEQTVCQSENLTFVSSIVQAINDAIVARG